MPIVYTHNGRERTVIGTLDWEKKIFSKKVQESKHLFRVQDAWGTDADYFTNVLLPNDYTLLFNDVETHVRYIIDAKTFAKHGIYQHFKSNGRDYGSQIFLSRRFWRREPYGTKVTVDKPVAPEPLPEPQNSPTFVL